MVNGGPNLFGLHQYDNQTTFFSDRPPIMSQGVGWAIVIGFGAVFAILTTSLWWLDKRYGGASYNSEEFNTCGRTIKTGLISVDIVSHWTWSSTLLVSSNQAFSYGVSGAFWYGAGACIQIGMFAVLAIEIKRKAPTAHTLLEMIRARWGRTAHLVFFYFCILVNLNVSAQLILGGSAVISALTGMSVYAACMLVPFGIFLFTAFGGLKSTFLSSYAHTCLIYGVVVSFAIIAFYKGESLGSVELIYNRLHLYSQVSPVGGNKGGSFLTMWSIKGLLFGMLQIVGGMPTVFCDQAYTQSAIAAKPSAAYKGYILGMLGWMVIPLCFGTTCGLVVRAMDLPLSAAEGDAGLVPPAAGYALLGTKGAVLVLVILFMAVTSSGSAEQIAVSSFCTYDLYREYINPKATNKQLLVASRVALFGFMIVQGVISVILNAANISLNFIFFCSVTVLASSVPPVLFCLCWSGCTRMGALVGALAGQAIGIIAWLVETHFQYHAVTIATTQETGPALTGALTSLLVSLCLSVAISLIWPEKYDWASMRTIALIDESDAKAHADVAEDEYNLDRALRRMWIVAGGFVSILVIFWPLLALPAGVFSLGYFKFWIVLSISWSILFGTLLTFYPLIESRDLLFTVFSNLVLRRPRKQAQPSDLPSATTDKNVNMSPMKQKAADNHANEPAPAGYFVGDSVRDGQQLGKLRANGQVQE